MKRSQINQLIRENAEFIKKHGFNLPPFADYTPEEYYKRAANAARKFEKDPCG